VNSLDSPTASRLDETSSLLEVPVDSHARLSLLNGVGVGIESPSERGSGSEGFVSPGERGVDDVLSVSTDGDESDEVKKQEVKDGSAVEGGEERRDDVKEGDETNRPLGEC